MKPRESNPAPLRLSLSGPTAIHDATSAAREFAKSASANPDDAAHLAIVVEELVTNLYDHGGLTAIDMIEMGLSASADEIVFQLVAPGKPFDPSAAVSSPEASSRGGGAGLRLVQTWSGRIDHEYTDGHNRLTAVLPIN